MAQPWRIPDTQNMFPVYDIAQDAYPNDVYPDAYPNDVYPEAYPNDVYPEAYPNDVYPDAYPNDVYPDAYPNDVYPYFQVSNTASDPLSSASELLHAGATLMFEEPSSIENNLHNWGNAFDLQTPVETPDYQTAGLVNQGNFNFSSSNPTSAASDSIPSSRQDSIYSFDSQTTTITTSDIWAPPLEPDQYYSAEALGSMSQAGCYNNVLDAVIDEDASSSHSTSSASRPGSPKPSTSLPNGEAPKPHGIVKNVCGSFSVIGCECGRTFTSCKRYSFARSNWKRHVRKYGILICPLCERPYNRPDNLQGHIRNKHEGNDYKHLTKQAVESTAAVETATRSSRPYTCPRCRKTYVTQDGLNQHMEQQHRG